MVHFPDYHMLPGDNLYLYRGISYLLNLDMNLQTYVASQPLLDVITG